MKKILALILAVVCMGCVFCGCGENAEATHDFGSKGDSISYPTLSEALNFIEGEFPEYKDSIVYLESLGNVVLQKNGILVGIYYDDGEFWKIVSKNLDFESAFEVIYNFYSDITEYTLTATELEGKMQEKTKMPNWTSYTYEENGLSYAITVGSDYVQIQVEK